jgi:hypothetical protein
MKQAGVSSILLVVVLFTVAVITQAQQPKKVYRIGYLLPLDPASQSTASETIRLALQATGLEGEKTHRGSQP